MRGDAFSVGDGLCGNRGRELDRRAWDHIRGTIRDVQGFDVVR